MDTIEIVLKNEKLKSYFRISWLIVLLNFSVILYLTVAQQYKENRLLPFSLLFFVFLFLIFVRGHKLNYKNKKIYTGIIYCVICTIWIYWHLYWAIALIFVFYLLFILATRKFEIIFSPDNIIYPSLPKSRIHWNELNNVVLKDGLLTIDFKNNKLVQALTEGDDFPDEKEFNDFCKKQFTRLT